MRLGKIIETGSKLHIVIRFYGHMSMKQECTILNAFGDLFEYMEDNDTDVMNITIPLLKVQLLAVVMTAMMSCSDLIRNFEMELK